MRAVIVAGGLGTRASGMTAGRIPKALLPIAGVPIVVRQMRTLRREGVGQLTVLAGHLGDQLQPALASEAAELGLALKVIIEPTPLGTAGCLAAVEPGTDETIIVYGDMLFDIALGPLWELHQRQDALLTLVAHPNDHPRDSDLIVERDGYVKAILPRGQPRDDDHRNLVPTGLYLASPAFFTRIEPGKKADMICELLPFLVAHGARIGAYNTPEYLRDVGTPARHAMAERDLLAGRVEQLHRANRRPAIFFDCDGVLNEEPGLHGAVSANDIRLIPNAGLAVRRAREAGRLTIGITNRPQVAKGFITFEGLDHILGRLEALLASDGGVLDRIYYCPHHPKAGFPGEVPALKVRCDCRKPGTLLLEQAVADLPIEPRGSAMIGDSLRDIGAARRFGIWAYGVRTGAGCRDTEPYKTEIGSALPIADLMFDDVLQAVNFNIRYAALAEPVLGSVGDVLNDEGAPTMIGLAGRSRGGKSVLAHAVVRSLQDRGISCLYVRLDDWIVPASMRGSNSSAIKRSRVEMIPDLIQALRSGIAIKAPGYDAVTRGAGQAVTYDPNGQSVIVLDGSFAAHHTVRPLLDLTVFVSVPEELQRQRFDAFYRWKGLDAGTIEMLWQQRTTDEWPAVDEQLTSVDLVVTSEMVLS